MRIAMFATIAATLLATAPTLATAQQSESELRARVRDMVLDRDQQSRARDGRWDWERGRDADDRGDDARRRDDDRRRDDEWRREGDRGRGGGWGWGWGRNDEWKRYEREQREFDRRTRHWSRRQWNAFRDCERDLWRRSRWDRNDSRREVLFERRRIRDYCERRVDRW